MTDMHRGHKIKQVYIYEDTKEIVSENPNRECGHCNKENTIEGHDGCLGTLPNVMNACCGHGNELEAYVQYLSGKVERGKIAVGDSDESS